MTNVTLPFFGSLYNSAIILKQLTALSADEMNLTILCQRITELLLREMKISSADIVLSPDYENPRLAPLVPEKAIDPKLDRLRQMIHHIKFPMVLSDLKNPADQQLLTELKIALIIPLIVGVEDVGLLVLGPKIGLGSRYTQSDIKFLLEFSSRSANLLKNANSYRKVQDFNRTLESKIIERTHQLDEFVFIATHDLAAPVTSIAGFLSLIKKKGDQLSPELTTYLAAIDEASSRLTALAKDLLEVARSDSGTIKVDLVTVDAGKLITDALQQATPLAKDKNIALTANLSPDNNVQADPQKLTEIFENIISNGIKYNKSGGSLTITTTSKDKSLVIEFKDTGLGIAADEQDKVFTKFFRSEAAVIRSSPGTGLGLFVVRMLTQKMGGKVSFKSVAGEGTTFWLEFSK